MTFACVAAMDQERGIGKNGTLPWRLPRELQHFHEVTLDGSDDRHRNVVIMGRRTWESIPEDHQPLQERLNVVLTRNASYPLTDGVIRAESLDAVLALLDQRQDTGNVFIIGGSSVFAETLKHPGCMTLHLTEVEGSFDCDTFFPEIGEQFARVDESPVQTERGIRYRFVTYERVS